MKTDELANLLSLFRRITPPQYWLRLGRQSGFRRRGIFCLPVVIWMMITQRLQAHGTLATAVQQLRMSGYRSLLRCCKRVRERRISAGTGGYCQARQKLSKLVASQIVDDVFERLQAVLREGWSGLQRPLFVLDGSTLLLEHVEDLKAIYPPAQNQHGRSHWPVWRIAVAHDVESGLAVRPCWGAAFGPEATSEQKLVEELLERLPAGAVVLADRNFGVFSVAWAADRQQHPVLFRLTNARARNLLGRKLEVGLDETVVWRPSRYERGAHPDLPAEASLSGRVIVCELKGAREPLIVSFYDDGSPGRRIRSHVRAAVEHGNRSAFFKAHCAATSHSRAQRGNDGKRTAVGHACLQFGPHRYVSGRTQSRASSWSAQLHIYLQSD
jgi:hypothetical protein